jgi:carbon storage regulator
MLILSRKPGESIVIDGRIVVKIVRLDGDMVKLGIDAPMDVPVHRQEVYDEIQRSNREALVGAGIKLPRLASGKPVVPAPKPPSPAAPARTR